MPMLMKPGPFKPVLGAAKPSVKNGLNQIASMPKPQGVPKPPTQPGLAQAAGKKRFGKGQQSALGQRLRPAGVQKNLSVWGVEHAPEEIAKKEKQASAGRHITAQFTSPIHGLVAGKKGHKLRAAGNELGGGVAGGVAGQLVNVAAKGKAPIAQPIGTAAGIFGGVNRAQKKGHFKTQS